MALANITPALANTVPSDGVQSVVFANAVANLEYSVAELSSTTRLGVHPPGFAGEIWYGQITRRMPGNLQDGKYDLPFAVSYESGLPKRAVCDLNLNDDFRDDTELTPYSYPAVPSAAAFLVSVQWTAKRGDTAYQVDWLLRIVAEPKRDLVSAPQHRMQLVRAPVGTFVLEGVKRRAVLYDGNRDGLYTAELGDGILVDSNGDDHFDVDPMSEEFGPLGTSFQLGSEEFEVVHLDPTATTLEVRRTATGKARLLQARVGEPAPDFFLESIDGRTVWLSKLRGKPVILDFFASWCSACKMHAPLLAELYKLYHARGLEIVGVSFDEKRTDADAFRQKFGITWPIEFSGHGFWENRVGRLYRAKDAGMVFLVNPDGTFDGEYDLVRLKERLAQIYERASASTR